MGTVAGDDGAGDINGNNNGGITMNIEKITFEAWDCEKFSHCQRFGDTVACPCIGKKAGTIIEAFVVEDSGLGGVEVLTSEDVKNYVLAVRK